jgi:tripartite ATP-independent transporter DctM subunit
MDYEWLSLLMFAGALGLLALGYPVAFSLGGTALIFAGIGSIFGVFDPFFLGGLPGRIFGIMGNYTLLAIPYFIFLGGMLEKTGLAEQLLETMGILFGRLRGGIALAVVMVGALLAASTGVVAATVVAMGLISLPIMLRYGYDKKLATGVIVASGTLGQLIPPSVVLVVLGDQLGISVGELFIGALIPGLLMASAFAIYVVIISFLKPEIAPALPPEVRNIGNKALGKQVIAVMIPPLALILLVLGSIFMGIATPTEAGAVGSVGAIALAAIRKQLSWQALRQVCDSTMQMTAMVIFILLGSTCFSLVFRGLGGDHIMLKLLSNVPGGQIGFLIVSMTTIFLLGFFLDFFEIAFIVVPIFLPVAIKLVEDSLGPGADLATIQKATIEYLRWYGVVIGTNLQTSFLTPPFGFALFFLRGVVPPEVKTKDIYQGAIPFIAIQLSVLILIIVFPDLVNFLPNLTNQP